MKLRTHSTLLRPAFTLVELLVSMALTLFVMTILVEAFGAGMDTFQNMRALGEVQDNLRSGLNLLKADLSHPMFEGGRKTSDSNFWDEPRREGFLRVEQASRPNPFTYVDEGTDLDGVNKSFLAIDHRISFSVRLRGNRRENFFFDSTGIGLLPNRLSATNSDLETVYGTDPLGSLTSQWGEIAYFLASPQTPPPTILETKPGLPSYGPIYLYNLYRAANLTVPYADELNKNAVSPAPFPRISRNNATGPPTKFLSPNDFAKDPSLRTKYFDAKKPILSSNENAALALVCTNVVSFQVRILRDPPGPGMTGYEDLPITAIAGAPPEPFDSAKKPASGYRLLGLQFVLRIYEPSTGLTRQATLNQDF